MIVIKIIIMIIKWKMSFLLDGQNSIGLTVQFLYFRGWAVMFLIWLSDFILLVFQVSQGQIEETLKEIMGSKNRLAYEKGSLQVSPACLEVFLVPCSSLLAALAMAVRGGSKPMAVASGGARGAVAPPVKKPPLKNNRNQNTYFNILGV